MQTDTLFWSAVAAAACGLVTVIISIIAMISDNAEERRKRGYSVLKATLLLALLVAIYFLIIAINTFYGMTYEASPFAADFTVILASVYFVVALMVLYKLLQFTRTNIHQLKTQIATISSLNDRIEKLESKLKKNK